MRPSEDQQSHKATNTETVPSRLFKSVEIILALLVGLSIGLLAVKLNEPPVSPTEHPSESILIWAGALSLGTLVALLVFSLRLRESERRTMAAETRLQTAIENISEGFVIYDKDERLIICNERYREMYPTIADKLIPGTRFKDLAQQIAKTNTPLETAIPSLDWQESCLAQFHNEQGELITQYAEGCWMLMRDRKLPDGGSVGIRTDITALKQHEEALIKSERRHRDLVERAPVAIYVHRDEVILYANSTTADMLGYDNPELLLGKNIFDLIHPDHHRLAHTRLDKAEVDDAPLPQVDMKFQRADDSIMYTEAQIRKVEYDGQPALESILRDITARRRTERALMESELRYRTLFELAPDAMLVHNGQDVLFTNAAAAQVFGVQDERKLVGVKLEKLLPVGANHDALTASSEVLAGADINETRFQRLDGETFHAEVVTAPTNYRGEAVYHTVIRDVTQRKLMDAAMAQNAKLASLGGMAAGLAHELSQPLNIMRFTAEGGLLKTARGKADEELHTKNYKQIQSQAERMGTIMDSMRIFSRKDPGPLETFDLTLAVRNIVHMMRNPFRLNNVHIDMIGAVSGVQVLGHPIQLEQVLLNLLKNAHDSIVDNHTDGHAEHDGRIEIDCRIHPTRGDAVIIVSDNGGGIVHENLNHIFDPFFTTKDVGKGTGLGLSLSHEIITGMSGTLSAENTPTGARFTITLPLMNTKSTSDCTLNGDHLSTINDPLVHTPCGTKEHHVLVVEDEAEAARAMADYLTEEGYHVTTANDGEAGLEAYREFTPDIVITDIRMPGISGTELIQALRHLDAQLPIIAVTGHMGETENIDSHPGSPPVEVLKKPVSLMELSRKIGDICTV